MHHDGGEESSAEKPSRSGRQGSLTRCSRGLGPCQGSKSIHGRDWGETLMPKKRCVKDCEHDLQAMHD